MSSDYTVELITIADVGVLLSKDWFEWADQSKLLAAGMHLVFVDFELVDFELVDCEPVAPELVESEPASKGLGSIGDKAGRARIRGRGSSNSTAA